MYSGGFGTMHLHTFDRVCECMRFICTEPAKYLLLSKENYWNKPAESRRKVISVWKFTKRIKVLSHCSSPEIIKKKKKVKRSGKNIHIEIEKTATVSFSQNNLIRTHDFCAGFGRQFAKKCLNARNVLYQSLISCRVLNEIRTSRPMDIAYAHTH